MTREEAQELWSRVKKSSEFRSALRDLLRELERSRIDDSGYIIRMRLLHCCDRLLSAAAALGLHQPDRQEVGEQRVLH